MPATHSRDLGITGGDLRRVLFYVDAGLKYRLRSFPAVPCAGRCAAPLGRCMHIFHQGKQSRSESRWSVGFEIARVKGSEGVEVMRRLSAVASRYQCDVARNLWTVLIPRFSQNLQSVIDGDN